MNKLFYSLLLLTSCFTITACHQPQELASESSPSCCACATCSCGTPSKDFGCYCSCDACGAGPTAHNDNP